MNFVHFVVDFAASYFDRIDRLDWNFVVVGYLGYRFELIDRPNETPETTVEHLVAIGSIHAEIVLFDWNRGKLDCPDPSFALAVTRFDLAGWSSMVVG